MGDFNLNLSGFSISYKSWVEIIFLYIKMNVCMFVCTLYKSTFLNRSEPNFAHLPHGLEETIGHVWAHNISPFPPFRPIFSGAGADSCAVAGCRRHTTPPLRYIRDAACSVVTSRTVGCGMKTRRSDRKACV